MPSPLRFCVLRFALNYATGGAGVAMGFGS
jgi:hypothetical protein